MALALKNAAKPTRKSSTLDRRFSAPALSPLVGVEPRTAATMAQPLQQ
jgi:hypothetical protein